MIIWLALAVVLGGLGWGSDFFLMLGRFFFVGIPQTWDEITANKYYRAFARMLKIAITLPIVGTVMALFLARSENTSVAQGVIFMTFAPSAVIFGSMLLLANVFGAIGAFLFVPTEKKRRAARLARIGLIREVSVYLAWELLIGYALLLVGVDATIGILGVSVWGIVLYAVACYAFNWQVKWAPYVMTTIGLGAFIVTTALVVIMMFPAGRRYAASWGINPGMFVHAGIVDTSSIGDVKNAALKKLKELCKVELETIKKDVEKALTPAEVNKLLDDLGKKEQECL